MYNCLRGKQLVDDVFERNDKDMLKNFLIKAVNSYMYSVGITAVFYCIMINGFGHMPLLDEYSARFDSDIEALIMQLVLIGFMSLVLGGGTVIFEFEKIGLVVQSVIYFIISVPVWGLVGNYCWGVFKYTSSTVTTMASYTVSYIICWVIQYKLCRKAVDDINQKLKEQEGN